MDYYHRNLPHWQPDNAEFFVTFRLAGSLPKAATQKLKLEFNNQKETLAKTEMSDMLSDLQLRKQRLLFKKYELLLDKADSGPTWLSEYEIAKIVCEAIHYRDQKHYDLYAYCIMPNHVHMTFRQLKRNEDYKQNLAVTGMLKNLKWFTALKSNQVLKRSGAFWQEESFDRVIRDQKELEATLKYVLNNPAKAGLVDRWQNWPYSYCKWNL